MGARGHDLNPSHSLGMAGVEGAMTFTELAQEGAGMGVVGKWRP